MVWRIHSVTPSTHDCRVVNVPMERWISSSSGLLGSGVAQGMRRLVDEAAVRGKDVVWRAILYRPMKYPSDYSRA